MSRSEALGRTKPSVTAACYAVAVNAVTLDLQPALPAQPFAEANARVDAWRGRCLEGFARAEAAATECLMALAEVKDRGASVRLPHLIGQRFEALEEVLAAGGLFTAEGGGALRSVEAIKAHLGLRTMLSHGAGRVTLDRGGKWTLVLRVATLRNRQIARDTLVLTEVEAEQLRDDVWRASQQLCSQLGQVRAKLKSKP